MAIVSTFVKTEPGAGENGRFHLLIPLWFLFSIFSDYKGVIMGRQKLRLVRARVDDNCYVNSIGDKKATISISSVVLRVKLVYPNDAIKLKLYEEIASNRSILMPFRSWEIHELSTLRASTKDVWMVKSTSERARYVIVFF